MKNKRPANEKGFVKFAGVVGYAIGDLVAIIAGLVAGLLAAKLVNSEHSYRTWIVVGTGLGTAAICASIGAVIVWAICRAFNKSNGNMNLVAHSFLSILYGGLWSWIWVGNATEFLNNAQNEEHRIPVSEMLMYMFVPFYSIYWFYEHAARVDWMSRCYGMDERDLRRPLFILCAIFLTPVASIILQNRINKLQRVRAARVMTEHTAY